MACGVCRTDLHVVDGELPGGKLPIIPGHEIVGRIDALGLMWKVLPWASGLESPGLAIPAASVSIAGRGAENLCDRPLFTGFTRNGGYATCGGCRCALCLSLGESGSDAALAPLLCAGLIGWRSLVMAGEGRKLGLYGFGAAAHIMAQVAIWQGRRVFAFTQKGDAQTQDFARSLGAEWAGGSDETPPQALDAAIIFAPVGALVPLALKAVRKGGRVVCAGIHMSDIPAFSYDLLWEERQLVSVANLTRQDGLDFLELAPRIGVKTHTTIYNLKDANRALADLRAGRFDGAAVLVP